MGVARQYCGQLGKQDNCQVAVSLSLANRHASLPVAYRLYLPEAWASDAARRKKTGVPEEIAFKTKPEIALEQIRAACAAGLPRGVVLMDAGYGAPTAICAQPSRRLNCLMSPAFCPIPRSGRPAPGRCHPRPGSRAMGGRPSACAAMRRISRSRPRTSPSVSRQRLGGRSLGARERMSRSGRALRACVFVLHGVTSIVANPGRKNGS